MVEPEAFSETAGQQDVVKEWGSVNEERNQKSASYAGKGPAQRKMKAQPKKIEENRIDLRGVLAMIKYPTLLTPPEEKSIGLGKNPCEKEG